MFRRPPDAEATLQISVDGWLVAARPGDSVAAAMLAAGILVFRRAPVSGAPRGPWCLMGACFDCLVSIDGVEARQACMTEAVEGMRIETRPAETPVEAP